MIATYKVFRIRNILREESMLWKIYLPWPAHGRHLYARYKDLDATRRDEDREFNGIFRERC
jgi:hypothetical protein